MANWQSKVLRSNRRQVAGHKSASNRGDHGIDCKQSCFIFQETGILVPAGNAIFARSGLQSKPSHAILKHANEALGLGEGSGASVKQTDGVLKCMLRVLPVI